MMIHSQLILSEPYWVFQMIISLEDAKHRINALIDQTISEVWRGYGSAIFIEIGELSYDANSEHPHGEHTIMVEWSWRVENQFKIIVGSWSDDELINNLPKLLLGLKIKSIEFFGHSPELSIQLSNQTWFTSFMTNDGDPMWSIKSKDSQWLCYVNGHFQIEEI